MKYIISSSNLSMDMFGTRTEANDVAKVANAENTIVGRDFRVEQIPLIGYYIAVYDHDEFDGYFIEVD